MDSKNWMCYNCKSLICPKGNTDSNGVLYCANCGVGNKIAPNSVADSSGPALPCIPPTEDEIRTPNGRGPGGPGYQDGEQTVFPTVKAYKDRHYVDPEVWLGWKDRGYPKGVKGFECPPEHSSPDKPSDKPELELKRKQQAGQLDSRVYLSELKKLLDAGKITQSYYDAEKKRVLGLK